MREEVLPKIFRSLDLLAAKSGIFDVSLHADRLVAIARRRTGLDDFGDWHFEEPLRVLTESYDREARLTPFGRLAARWDMVRFLSNLLRLRDEEKRDPSIVSEKIDRPIFVLGLPRSGTTFLHQLLSLDPDNRVPRCWQTIYPYPIDARTGAQDRRAEIVDRQFRNFLRISPELPSLHPLDARAAQECIEITGQVMRSLRFDTTHYIPTYMRWLDDAGHLEAYRFHKRFLQHLQHQVGPGPWMLKTPDHIFAFDALAEVYPDARFIFVHRDPMRVMASVAKLTEILRKPFASFVDRLQIGRQVSERWVIGAGLLIHVAERLKTAPKRIWHLRYDDLVRDPLAQVAEIYRHFEMPLGAQAVANLRHEIAARPDGGYGANSYSFKDFGLSEPELRARFHDYVEHFQVECESRFAPRKSREKVRAAR